MRAVSVLRARDNERVRRWARLVRDARYRRREGATVAEGPHLLATLLERRIAPRAVLVSEERLGNREIDALLRDAGMPPVAVSDAVFRHIVDTEAPQGIAAEIAIAEAAERSNAHAVFLEGVQDPGNVGAILRSAAAFGFGNAILDRGCADPWSPRVLRAAMGGHFSLSIRQVAALGRAVLAFRGRTVCAAPRGGEPLRQAELSGRVGWILGSEGAGVTPALRERAQMTVTVPLAPGAESLNVAAAAAVCFYETVSRPDAGS